MERRTAPDRIVNGPGKANGGPESPQAVRTCQACQRRFRAKSPRQRFCGPTCRERAWWLDDLIRAMLDGRAEGLRRQLEKLAAASAAARRAK